MPDQKKARFVGGFGLSPYDAGVLVAERESADFYETVLARLADKARDSKRNNWVINELFGRLNKGRPRYFRLASIGGSACDRRPDRLRAPSPARSPRTCSRSSGRRAAIRAALVETRGMKQVTDLGAIEKVVDDIISANPDQVAQAKAKPQMVGWFVGQVMKSSGKANPQAVNDLLKSKLGI